MRWNVRVSAVSTFIIRLPELAFISSCSIDTLFPEWEDAQLVPAARPEEVVSEAESSICNDEVVASCIRGPST